MMLGVGIELGKLRKEGGRESTFFDVANKGDLEVLEGMDNLLGEFSPKL